LLRLGAKSAKTLIYTKESVEVASPRKTVSFACLQLEQKISLTSRPPEKVPPRIRLRALVWSNAMPYS